MPHREGVNVPVKHRPFYVIVHFIRYRINWLDLIVRTSWINRTSWTCHICCYFLVKAIFRASTLTMPIPHPHRRVGGGHMRHQMGHVRDRAPPGWYEEALPTGGACWWGASLSLTRTFFCGGRVGQWRSIGSRTPWRWCVTMSVRRTRTSVATCLRWSTGSPGISLELWSCDGAFSLGVHRPRGYPSCARVLVLLVILYVWYYLGCIRDNIRRCTDAWDDLLLLIECMLIWILIYFTIWFFLLNAHLNMSPIRFLSILELSSIDYQLMFQLWT